MAIKRKIRRKIRRKSPAVRRRADARTANARSEARETSGLMIGGAHDPAEKAADTMAAQVMAGGAAGPGTVTAPGGAVQRMCAECRAQESENIHRKDGGGVIAPGKSSVPAGKTATDAVNGLGSGRYMSNSEKSFFEPKFGKSFSQVRIHEGLSVDKASAAIDAKAFTRGNDIAFARGQKTSATMAHELAHVVQTNGRVQRKVFRVCAKADKLAEGKFKAQPVVIADDDGKNKTTKPSFAKAKSIWAKCCLALDELSPITVKKKAYKDLQSSPAAAGTVEEKAMIADAGAGADTVPVFAVETITEGGTTSKDNSGGGYTLTGPNVVVVDAGTSWLSAHEIGHALGATHAQGTRGDGSDTVMKATSKHNSAGSDKVSAAIATTVRASGIVTGTGGSKTCCPDNS